MKKRVCPIYNNHGSALLVSLLLLPVVTLFCIFAATIGNQDLLVTTNDTSHRVGLYNADASIYGAAKLISKIATDDRRSPISAGAGNDAPGITYSNSDPDPAAAFSELLSDDSTLDQPEDLQFVKLPGSDTGIESTVDISKANGGGNIAGGGAEFGAGAEGAGTQLQVAVFRIRGEGKTRIPNSTVRVEGDYWRILGKGAGTKGI